MQSLSSPEPTRTIALSAIVDREAVALLLPELREALGMGSLRIEAARVERIGQAGLQLLISAARTAADANRTFAIENSSPALCRAARLAGVADHLALPDAE
jgi:ABC-type transporter Mla MlaB component